MKGQDIPELITKSQIPIIEDILHERVKQEAMWGKQKHNDFKWLAILAEEVGEIAENINEHYPANDKRIQYPEEAIKENLRYELIQVAAVCFAWLESFKMTGGE